MVKMSEVTIPNKVAIKIVIIFVNFLTNKSKHYINTVIEYISNESYNYNLF